MIFSILFSKWLKKRLPARPSPLYSKGSFYDLDQMYEEVNQEYFDQKLDLKITWFGSAKRAAFRVRRLGLYDQRQQLIKIHRLLDNALFPSFFVSYVIYHEMLHHVCPPVHGKRGRRKVHHAAFYQRERQFRDYALARKWEKENLHRILNCKEPSYGRS